MPNEPTLTLEDLVPLHENELALLHMLRTRYRYGKVEIETQNGIPVFVSRTVEREKLGVVKLSTPDLVPPLP
jgi:hypothetical protein